MNKQLKAIVRERRIRLRLHRHLNKHKGKEMKTQTHEMYKVSLLELKNRYVNGGKED